MADRTSIEWTDGTWNPVTGCSVVSPGCTNCYAMRLAGTRLQHHPSRAGLTHLTKGGPVWTGEVRFNEGWLAQPLRWRRPRKIFVCAHGDLFAEGVPDEWIDRVFAVMAMAPQHTFQVLTKRSARMRAYCSDPATPIRVALACVDLPWICDDVDDRELRALGRWPVESIGDPEGPHDVTLRTWPLPNVWLGVSAENQRRAEERVPDLLVTPAAVRFVSAEPLLGWITFTDFDPDGHFHPYGAHGWSALWRNNRIGRAWLDWIIVGGESGPDARPMHPDWARSIRNQCAAAGVPFHFKQWGEYKPLGPIHADDDAFMHTIINADENRSLILCSNGREWQDATGQPPDDTWMVERVGKKIAGRLLDGVEHNGMPGMVP